jgi:hypothetical protein
MGPKRSSAGFLVSGTRRQVLLFKIKNVETVESKDDNYINSYLPHLTFSISNAPHLACATRRLGMMA